MIVGLLWAFFEGGVGEVGVFAWCFCGEVVVNWVVNRGCLTVVFAGSKTFQVFEIILWKSSGGRL
jgi:hypothetical protein